MKTVINPEKEMKDTGIEWVGLIPKNWYIRPLYACLDEINQKNSPIVTMNILSLTNTDGVIPYSERGNQGNKSKENLEDYKVVYPNMKGVLVLYIMFIQQNRRLIFVI